MTIAEVVLCHYPIMCYNGQYLLDKGGNPRTYMLYACARYPRPAAG
ncbi:MAG: hypothetical protein ACLVAW_22815 [Eisenbergiella massiliensis]